VPAYIAGWQEIVGLALTIFLILMLALEPILHCMSAGAPDLFDGHCAAGKDVLFTYSVFSAMALLCYYVLLVDLAVFSTRVSAFALVCGRLLSEVALFLTGLAFFVAAFASAVSALQHDDDNFDNIPISALSLLKVSFGMLGGPHFDVLNDSPALLFAIIVYVICTVIFLLNLLVAQLSCAYASSYQDMLGFARLNRGKIVTITMPSVSTKKWASFVESLRFGERVEFGEGDLGLAGGLQTFEAANLNLTTIDMIRRFGGSTSPAAQWPEEDGGDDQNNRFERIEQTIEKAMKRMSSSGGKKGGGSKMASSGGGESSAHESGGSQASGSE
jgi:uncharacterized membrane protein YgcG